MAEGIVKNFASFLNKDVRVLPEEFSKKKIAGNPTKANLYLIFAGELNVWPTEAGCHQNMNSELQLRMYRKS